MYTYKTQALESKLFWALSLVLFFLSGSYVYLIQESIVNVVERRTALSESAALEGEIASLEGAYLKKIGYVTLERAYEIGFVDVSGNTTFAYGRSEGGGRVGLVSSHDE